MFRMGFPKNVSLPGGGVKYNSYPFVSNIAPAVVRFKRERVKRPGR